MADDKIALSIEIESDRANMSLGELEDGFEELQKKLKATNRGTEEGRKEFKRLASQMAQTSKEIKNIELSFEGLDREQVASEIGSVAGAVGDLSASLIILSGDNETLEATAQNIEKAMMVSMGLKGAIEGLSSARKLYNNLLRQANEDEKEGIALTVLKTAKEKAAAAGTLILNTVNKLLNTTLKANPIGILVTALTLVVAGIVYFKDAIWGLIQEALKPFQYAIDAVVDALQFLGIMESDSAIATRKAEEEKARAALESAEKRTEATEKLIEAHTKLTDSIVADMDFEIRKRKANGKETTELELEKLRVLIEAAKKERELQAQRREDLRQEIMLRLQQGKVFGTELSENMKALEESFKAEEKLKADQLQAEQDLEISLIEIKKAGTEKRKKAAVEQKKIDEKAAKDAIALEKEKNKLLEDLEAKAIADKNTRALAELELAQEREREQLIEKYGKDTELMLALEEEQLLQMNTLIEGIEQEARDKKAEADKLAKEKELQDIQEIADAKQKAREEGLVAATQVIDSLSSLNNMALQNDLKNAGDNEKLKEQLRKASFEREKKLNIAMALVNGAQAQMSILAQTPKADFGIATAIAMAAAAVTTIAQIAAIKATSYQGGGSPAASESATAPSAGGAGAAGGGAAITPVSNTSTILGNQQVFVTETDITNTQNNVSVIEESATF